MDMKIKGKGVEGSQSSRWQEENEDDHDVPWWMRNVNRISHTKMEFPRFEGGDLR